MIINNTNYKEILSKLEENNYKLSSSDRIIFTVDGLTYEYRPRVNYLSAQGFSNTKIFKVLGLDEYKFCQSVYGYKPTHGIFPVCDFNPEKNLIRITRALFDKCIETDTPVKTIELSAVELSVLKDREQSPKIADILDMF